MKRKALLSMLIALTLALVVSGCGSKSGGGSDNQASGGASPSSDQASAGSDGSGEKITLKFMSQWPQGGSLMQYNATNKIIQEFEEANPNITINTEVMETNQYKSKLKVLAASNDLPDVGFTWAAGFMEPYVKGNEFAPLNDLLEGDLKDKFVAGTTEAYSFDGKTYALPVELNIVPIFYNKAIFKKYNLEVPKTYEDFKNIIKTLNDNGVVPITLGGKDGWTSSFWYMYLADRIGGSDLMDQSVANNTFTDPSLIKAAEEVQKLVDMNAFIKGFNGLSNDEAKAQFMNGNAAMYAMGTWEVPNYTTNPDVPQEFKDNIGFFKFPTVEGGKGSVDDWVGGVGVGLFVSQHSKHIEAAKKFVDFFVQKWGEDSVTGAGVIPGTKVDTTKGNLPQMYVDLLNQLNNAHKVILYLDVQMKPVASDTHHNLVQALFGKQLTPEQFAKQQEDALKAGK
jgi:raffinose/stachyose/melibiose transport system substrate-binding protein